jgi:peptide/nickel transport system permease protein
MKIPLLQEWLAANTHLYPTNYTLLEKTKILFLETRFCKYISKVATLDFGTLRKDQNKLVISEVAQRLKISFSLSLAPLFLSFFAALALGMVMAWYQNRLLDITLNTFFLILFTIPVFVVAPFLIEKLALHKNLPFTDIPMPLGGFHSEAKIYGQMTSLQQLGDILLHLALPLMAILYGSLAIQSRLSRTAILQVLRQDHVKTAFAKGLPLSTILVRHVGKNAAIPLVTSLASSLGAILGGALIVETVFEINGFGRFFYDAIVNRDYNVILFSAFAGSLLTLVGYLLADITYTLLDPRVGFGKQEN